MQFWNDGNPLPFEDHVGVNAVRWGSLLVMVKVSGQGKRWGKVSQLFASVSLPADPASRISGIMKQKWCFPSYLNTRDFYTFKTSYNLLLKNSQWLGDFHQEVKTAEVLLLQDRKAHLVTSLSLICEAYLKTDASIFWLWKIQTCCSHSRTSRHWLGSTFVVWVLILAFS